MLNHGYLFFNLKIKTMKKLLYLFTAILLVFTSCSKDDNDSSDSTLSILPKKIITINSNGDSSTENIIYNGNKIVSITGENYIIKYSYIGDFITKIEKFDKNGALDFTTQYSYTNGKLTGSTAKETGAASYSKVKFVHNEDGTVSYEDFRINSTTNAEDDGGYIGKFTFKDGNLIKNDYSYYGAEKLITYEYDTKNNPLKNIKGFNLLLNIESPKSYVNNMIGILDLSGSVTAAYTYKYDANNYPTETNSTNSTRTTQFSY